MLDFSDYFYMVCVSILKAIIILIYAYLLSNLLIYNHELGIFIADNLKISHALAFTFNTLGFVNNITMVLTIFDLIILGIVINQLSKYRITHRLFNHFSHFMRF